MPQLAWWCCDSSSGPRKSFQKILTGCTLHNYPSSALSNIWSTWKDKERKGQKKKQMYCTGHEVSRKKSTTQVMRLKARRSAISPGETTNAIHKEPEGVPAKDKAWRHGRVSASLRPWCTQAGACSWGTSVALWGKGTKNSNPTNCCCPFAASSPSAVFVSSGPPNYPQCLL